ncbi:MAG: rhomboid family intramembrane serine protease [Bacteroidia bacterium]
MRPELQSILKSFLPGFLLIAVLAAVRYYEAVTHLHLTHLGLFPRSFEHLSGMLTFPLIHRDNEHLYSNAIPLFILSAMLFYFYRDISWKVLFLSWILSGFWLWLGGRPPVHVGASGVVYGLASFIFFSGVWRRERRMMAVSMTVVFLYGGMVWGLFPFFKDVSWEGHLFGGLSGLLLSWAYRKEGPQRVVYDWENEPEEDESPATDLHTDHSPVAEGTAVPEQEIPFTQSPSPAGPLFNLQPQKIQFDYVEKKAAEEPPKQSE